MLVETISILSQILHSEVLFAMILSVTYSTLKVSAPLGVANGILKILGLGKFLSDLEISEAFVLSLGISFLHAYIFCVSVLDFCAYRLGLGFSN